MTSPAGETEPRERARRPRGCDPTGATLFPELVWAHFDWARAGQHGPATNGVRDGADSAPAHASLRRSEQAYRAKLVDFQQAEGRLVDAYWCWNEASAVALTERWIPFRSPRIRLYRVTDWVTTDLPRIADLLHRYDALALKASHVLMPTPKRIVLGWIFAEQRYLLGFAERTARRPSPRELADVLAEGEAHLGGITQYYESAGDKAARIYYFLGMVAGMLAMLALGSAVGVPLVIGGEVDGHSPAVQNFFAAYAGGAIGAVVSVMTRMRHEANGFRAEFEVGRLPLVFLGSFRPVIGAVFGTVTYFALETSSVQFDATRDNDLYFFALAAFLAGFSERFTHVILGHAEDSVGGATRTGPLPADGEKRVGRSGGGPGP